MADLRVAGRRHRQMGEDVEPAVGLINLADIMLVFATGLMMALVTFWQIDIGPQFDEVLESSQMTEVSDLEEAKDLLQSGGTAYSEVGTVFKDPKTGKLYMLSENVEGSENSVSQESAHASTSEDPADSTGTENAVGGTESDSTDGRSGTSSGADDSANGNTNDDGGSGTTPASANP